MAVTQRLDRGLDDEIGGAKVRLADAEIDDVAALRDQSIGASQHGEGVFLADAVEGRDRFQHGVTPRTYPILRAVHPIGVEKSNRRQQIRLYILQTRRSGKLHGAHEFDAQMFQHVPHAIGAMHGEAPQRRPADHHRAGAEREGF